jgi:hypothetical protein
VHLGKNGRAAVLLIANVESGAAPRIEMVAGEAIRASGGNGEPVKPPADTAKTNSIFADAWNQIEVRLVGRNLQVGLNGKKALLLDATRGQRFQIALEARAAQDVRFAQIDLELLGAGERKSP